MTDAFSWKVFFTFKAAKRKFNEPRKSYLSLNRFKASFVYVVCQLI